MEQISRKKKELGLQEAHTVKSELSEKSRQRKMGLDEFLRRFTSEDNASFEALQELQQKQFLAQISWMHSESDQYKKINQLALENGQKQNGDNSNPTMITDGKGQLRTIPELALVDCDPQPNIFFKNPSQEDLKTKSDIRDALAKLKDTIGPSNQVVKANTRLPSTF